MEGKSLFKGDTYKLLDSTFTASDEYHNFDAWEVDGERLSPGTEIVVTKDTVIKALFKNITTNVSFKMNGHEKFMKHKL